MAEKFDPAPADKHADSPKQREAADKKADDEPKKGLKDSFPASDPPSSIQPSKTVTDAKMTTISKSSNTLTLINTFKVAPDKQQALIDLLDRATVNVMRKQPGFISANIHRSLDGTKVANYAQWRSKADLEAMQKNPEAGVHMKEAAALADSFEPILYEVFSVHGG